MEKKYIQSLLKKGYFIFDIKKKNYLKLKSHIEKQLLKNNQKLKLENLHKLVEIKSLNRLRMNLFNNLNKSSNFKKNVFESSQQFIESCVGSEICSSDINLSIQMPNDETSLLEMHTDFFSGESLFQVNLWIPFVNVKKTQSMFIIDPINSYKILKKIKNIRYKNIFSPYGNVSNEKKIGSFYKILSPKAVTLFNLKHNFDEII